MDRVILSISKSSCATVGSAHATVKNARVSEVSKEIIILGLVLATLQIVDGILTGIGVAHLGTEVEGNSFIRMLMEHLGYIPALVLIKTIALMVIAGICALSSRVQWLSFAMKTVIFIYLSAAVIPWTFVIAKHIL